jgi:hypothetical protein
LWLKEGIHDYLAPQIYWTIGEQQNPNDPDFTVLCSDWKKESSGRQIYAGIGIYRENVQQEVHGEVLVSRNIDVQGQVFFRWEQIPLVLSKLRYVYRFPVLIPPMLWKDSIPPLSPLNISVRYGEDNLVQWKVPPIASDGEIPYRYVVYRSIAEEVDIHKPENILAVIPGGRNSYIDINAGTSENKFFYTVTSLDRLWNESRDDTLAPNAYVNRVPEDARSSRPVLAKNYPNPFSARTYISYEISERSNVKITLLHKETKKETVILDEVKNAGVYILTADCAMLPPGEIEYRMTAGKDTLSKVMIKK